ncbi:hypothetical protein AAMO2058_000401200 [Amorphochlora amoebiformis]
MTLRVLLLGFGGVGRAICEILASRGTPGISAMGGALNQMAGKVNIVGVLTKTRGAVWDENGIDLNRLMEGSFDDPNNPHWTPPGVISSQQAVNRINSYDVLMELSVVNMEEKGFPAAQYIHTALTNHKHVVTANKGPVAFHYKSLKKVAQDNNCILRFESAVMDGAPIFCLKRAGLRSLNIRGLQGLLNSTSTYVFQRMGQGLTLENALTEAQEMGIAEADPSKDLNGHDSACKLAALANVFMDADLSPDSIRIHHHLHDIKKTGGDVRMVSSIFRTKSGLLQPTVDLKNVEKMPPFNSVSGTGACLTIYSDLMAPISIMQHAPTLSDTAFGVLEDLYEVWRFHQNSKF